MWRTSCSNMAERCPVSMATGWCAARSWKKCTEPGCTRRSGRSSARSIVTPGVEATKDGLVGLGVGTGQQWLDFCVMVDHSEWMEDRKLFADRAHLAPEIASWAAERTTEEVLELAALWRIPHAPIGN